MVRGAINTLSSSDSSPLFTALFKIPYFAIHFLLQRYAKLCAPLWCAIFGDDYRHAPEEVDAHAPTSPETDLPSSVFPIPTVHARCYRGDHSVDFLFSLSTDITCNINLYFLLIARFSTIRVAHHVRCCDHRN